MSRPEVPHGDVVHSRERIVRERFGGGVVFRMQVSAAKPPLSHSVTGSPQKLHNRPERLTLDGLHYKQFRRRPLTAVEPSKDML